MISFPSRSSVLALGLTVGFLSSALAQTSSPAPGTVHSDSLGRHLAPRDTFYTTEYVSATTDKGVEGFPPGTEVHLVSVNSEKQILTVSDGRANVDVSPDKLTNDMDLANMVRTKDDYMQGQIAAHQQAAAKAYQEYQKEVADYTAKDLEKRQQANRDAQQKPLEPTVSQSVQPVNASGYNNAYYNEGGYGYGSPYYYFTPGYASQTRTSGSAPETKTNGAPGTTTGGRGVLPSNQAGSQSSSRQTGTTTSGGQTGTTSGGGQSAGGKKP